MSIHKRETAKGPRYDVRLRDLDGKTYTRTWRTKDEAKAYERAELTARDRGDWIDPAARARTFDDVAAEWLASNPAKRPVTVARDRGAIERHLSPAFGSRRIGAIQPKDLQALVHELSGKMVASSTIRTYAVAAAVFRYAVDRDYIAKSPTRTVKLPKVGRASVHVFTPEELVALADAMPVEHAPMVWLGAVLGLRWGEVAALHVRDVDLLAGELHVRHSLTKDGRGRTVVGAPKSDAGTRTIAIPAPLVQVLAAHLRTRQLTAADPDALLFPDGKGGPLVASNWRRRVWLPAALAAGVGCWVTRTGAPWASAAEDGVRRYEGAVFHDLRRTSATGLVAEGVDVKTAQARLGHSAVRLTLELYAQAVPAEERRAADLLSARLMPGLRRSG